MKYNYRKVLISILMIIAIILFLNLDSFAHSGRTDSSGGHKDNKNASGLGSYHYHCGGNPPHLHTNGVCPYSSNKSTKSTSSSSNSSTSNTSNKSSTTSSTSSSYSSTTSSTSNTNTNSTTTTSNNVSESSNNTEKSNPIGGILTVGLVGAGGYLIFKRKKN